jgi:hypothetical protein
MDRRLDSYMGPERVTYKFENPRKEVRPKNCSLNKLYQKTKFLVEVTPFYLLNAARLRIVAYYSSPSVFRLYLKYHSSLSKFYKTL